MERNFEDEIQIDRNQLEVEWEKQPSLYYYYAKKEVDALEIKDKAVRNLAVIKAQVDAAVRRSPADFGLDKVTEASIAGVVATRSNVEDAELAVIAATKNSRLLNAGVSAIEHKKTALSKETDLYINGYYQTGGVPTQMKGDIENRKRGEIENKLTNSILRRRKEN